MERLALELLLCTALRRSDAVRMGWQNILPGGDEIEVRCVQKTGVALVLPFVSDLKAAAAAMPKGMTFLTLKGRSFTPVGFSQWFKRQCRDAGIPRGYTAHGLRKAACRRLAEAGCSASVIAAVTGHKTLRAVEAYVRAADQARLARMGAAAVSATFGVKVETSPVNPALPVSKKA